LDREEAIKLFKEVITKCKINIASVSLVPPRKDDTISDGFQLHIKSFLSSCDREEIQRIVHSQRLAWKEINEGIVIYKPQSKEVLV
jgi:hypothetical protein